MWNLLKNYYLWQKLLVAKMNNEKDPVIDILIDGEKIGEVDNFIPTDRKFKDVYDITVDKLEFISAGQVLELPYYFKSINYDFGGCDFIECEEMKVDYLNITGLVFDCDLWEREIKQIEFQKSSWDWLNRKY